MVVNKLSKEDLIILNERAVLLAKEDVKNNEFKEHIKVLEFTLANKSLAIESKYITKVIQLKELTPIPCSPPFMLGVINVNAKIISVINLNEIINQNSNDITNLNSVILVKYNEIELGILADKIIQNSSISVDKMQANLPVLNGIKNEFIAGIIKNTLPLIDIQRILISDEIIINDRI